jgi:hypothetical protein
MLIALFLFHLLSLNLILSNIQISWQIFTTEKWRHDAMYQTFIDYDEEYIFYNTLTKKKL